ncbi:MAG: hypothetical protein ACREKE_09905 [bacterium]
MIPAAQAPRGSGVDAVSRDFTPGWHLRVVLISAAVLLACLLAAWKIFL